MTKTLVLAVGDVSSADESAGAHAMRYLKDHYDLPDTAYLDAGTPSVTLAAEIAAADILIVFNTAQLDADPGTIRIFEDDDVDLADLIEVDRLDNKLPTHCALISIQPGQTGSGGSLSETVRRSLPKAAGNAATLIQRWRRSESVFSTGLHSLPNSV
ncbi:MAG: hydrogenase maturation protease [Gammaproteobacteria bacterium]|nr:hydrogenase maturation protease [Gammaproteobacteria bacterium]MDH3372079.1 hydrogenase maturation protease [Gammaproteobacteria bacterium]MDH3551699.1 hydrogenase maturation protease [Gammaproteobacteria bacterium]